MHSNLDRSARNRVEFACNSCGRSKIQGDAVYMREYMARKKIATCDSPVPAASGQLEGVVA